MGLTNYAEKMNANNDAIKEWTRKTLEGHRGSVRSVEENVTRRLETLQRQILEEQPKYLECVISTKLRTMALDTADIKQRVEAKLSLQNESAHRAELTCSKIADDVYHRLQSQRCDLFEHIKNVELRITAQLKEAIAHIRIPTQKGDGDCEFESRRTPTIKLERKRSRSIGATAMDRRDHAHPQSTIDIGALREQMRDYRSEMIHSQQKLSEFEEKMKVIPSRASDGLAELDRKYSSIQSSISGLQQMMSEHSNSAPRKEKKGNNKKKEKKKKRRRSMMGGSHDFVPSHLTPHLSDLDNLVQSVFEADQLDRRHSNAKLTKKRKSQTALLRASCPNSVRPSSAPRKKKGALWK